MLCQVISGYVRLGQVISVCFMLCQVISGSFRLGKVKSG